MTQKTRPDIAEWLRSLGNVPLDRIVMDPLPGTATEQDLLRLVERDKRLVELIEGTLVEKPVGWMESRIAAEILFALMSFVKPRRLGYVAGADGTLKMKAGNVRLPDVSFVSVEDIPGGVIPTEPIPELPPTIAVEVVSKGNTAEEMRLKTKEYFDSGARLVWRVYPKTRTIAVFDHYAEEPAQVLSEGDVLDGGKVLPGFSVPVSEVFAPLKGGQ